MKNHFKFDSSCKGDFYLPTYQPTYLPTYLLTYLLTYLPTYLLTYLPTNLPIAYQNIRIGPSPFQRKKYFKSRKNIHYSFFVPLNKLFCLPKA